MQLERKDQECTDLEPPHSFWHVGYWDLRIVYFFLLAVNLTSVSFRFGFGVRLVTYKRDALTFDTPCLPKEEHERAVRSGNIVFYH